MWRTRTAHCIAKSYRLPFRSVEIVIADDQNKCFAPLIVCFFCIGFQIFQQPIHTMRGLISAASTEKHSLPVDRANAISLTVPDKSPIYSSLSVLMEMDIKDILVVAEPSSAASFQRMLGDGSQWGIRLSYALQNHPGGMIDSLMLGEEFVGHSNCCLVSDDGLFLKTRFIDFSKFKARLRGAHVIVQSSDDPQCTIDKSALHVFDSTVFNKIRILGECGIDMAALYELYRKEGRLFIEQIGEWGNR